MDQNSKIGGFCACGKGISGSTTRRLDEGLSCPEVLRTMKLVSTVILAKYTVCLTRYRNRCLFNNSNNNEDIAMKFEPEYVCCVRNEEEWVCSVCL